MLLQYGRLNLNLISVDSYERTPVHDQGQNYLYTRHKLTVTATFNPAVQAEFLNNDPTITRFNAAAGGSVIDAQGNAVPFVPTVPNALPNPIGPLSTTGAGLPALGSSPVGGPVPGGTRLTGAYMVAAIKHELAQPRQSLVFSVGGTIVLHSPLPGFDVDCTNGPVVLGEPVVKMVGTRLFKVQVTIQTDVNEAPLRGSGGTGTNYLHAVLTHRWSMQHDLDSDFFVKRVIRGRLVFRADVLDDFALDPDDFRRYFFHPVPRNFARRDVKVKALDDAVTLDYEVTDQQLPLVWTEATATRVEAVHTIKLHRADLETTTLKMGLDWTDQMASDLTGAMSLNPLDWAKGFVHGMTHTATGFGRWGMAALPVSEHTCTVEVWGNPNSTRNTLADFAANVINARVGFVRLLGLTVGGFYYEWNHFPTEKHVRLTGKFTTGPLTTVPLVIAGAIDMATYFGPNDNTGNLLLTDGIVAGPTDDAVGRDASYLEVCVAGALTGDAGQGAQAKFNPPAPGIRATAAQAPTADF